MIPGQDINLKLNQMAEFECFLQMLCSILQCKRNDLLPVLHGCTLHAMMMHLDWIYYKVRCKLEGKKKKRVLKDINTVINFSPVRGACLKVKRLMAVFLPHRTGENPVPATKRQLPTVAAAPARAVYWVGEGPVPTAPWGSEGRGSGGRASPEHKARTYHGACLVQLPHQGSVSDADPACFKENLFLFFSDLQCNWSSKGWFFFFF